MKTVSPDMAIAVDMAQRRKRFNRIMLRTVFILGIVIGVQWAMSPWYKLTLNMNHSLPGYLYVLQKGVAIQRGDIMAYYPPDNRFYKHSWFSKYAAGVAGDVIVVKNREFYLGDKYLGRAKEYSTKGELLNPSMMDGEYVIPEGNYFTWTPHEDSFDSRYEDIGLIKESAILGRVYRIL